MYKDLSYSAYLLTLLIFIAPFVMAATDIEQAEILHSKVLPPIVSTVASALRWFLFIVITINFLVYMHNFHSMNEPPAVLIGFIIDSP